MLSLYECQIGDQGAIHLANALKTNAVKQIIRMVIYILYYDLT
jgi:hypothetical protein